MSTRSSGGWPPPGHQRPQRPHGWHKRTESSKVTGNRRWRVVRDRVMRRAAFTCEIDGCENDCIAVDHIHPVSLGGEAYDETNLQALCKPHHDTKTASEASQAAARKRAAPKPRRRSQIHPADVLRGDAEER